MTIRVTVRQFDGLAYDDTPYDLYAVPRVGEIMIIDDKAYSVEMVTHDPDNDSIVVKVETKR